MGLHISSDKYPVGETVVPSQILSGIIMTLSTSGKDHFLICVKAGLKAAQKKNNLSCPVSAITQESNESPVAFLGRV